MPLNPNTPISYLITDGRTTHDTDPSGAEFARLLALIAAGVAAGVTLIQVREKSLRPRLLYELIAQAVAITKDSATRLLVNDHADIALAAGADGVHLTTRSLDPLVVRRIAPRDFLIGVSTHTLSEAQTASASDADFAVFGPVFDTSAKYVDAAPPPPPPPGLDGLREAAHALAPFPLLALGGVTRENIRPVIQAGAQGIAAIRLFSDESQLDAVVNELRVSRAG